MQIKGKDNLPQSDNCVALEIILTLSLRLINHRKQRLTKMNSMVFPSSVTTRIYEVLIGEHKIRKKKHVIAEGKQFYFSSLCCSLYISLPADWTKIQYKENLVHHLSFLIINHNIL